MGKLPGRCFGRSHISMWSDSGQGGDGHLEGLILCLGLGKGPIYKTIKSQCVQG